VCQRHRTLAGAKLPCWLNTPILFSIFLVFVMLIAQAPRSQAATSNSRIRPCLFLRMPYRLNMTKYTSTLTENNQPSAGKEYLSYSLDAFLESHASAILYFNNGTLASCRLPVSWGSLLYAQANSDSFNVAVGIIQGYQRWTIDSDVQEMVIC
jgi:hypothetical protein